MHEFDTIILGAGIIGVSTALHLQARGQSVCVIDRKQAGEGTSFGNAGLIERSSVIPYSFPRGISALLKYARNNRTDVRYDIRYLPKIAPWLFQFWRNSSPQRLAQATEAMLPLVEASVTEHNLLIEQAGCQHLISKKGWIEAYRDEKTFRKYVSTLPELDRFTLNYKILDATAFSNIEPSMREVAGAVHWLDPETVSDPSALVKSYAALFIARGGKFCLGDAQNLQQDSNSWSIETISEGRISAQNAVVALGPQSDLIYHKFGYTLPMAVKRGTHLHFNLQDGAQLHHPVVEAEGGYVLSSMRAGIRLSTGIEFAAPDAPVNRILIDRAIKRAREVLPMLGQPIEHTPWLGLRPCLPDMRPIISAAPLHNGLWFNFGHAHHGLTLGPASGRLLAEMITGGKPFTDPHAYALTRFL